MNELLGALCPSVFVLNNSGRDVSFELNKPQASFEETIVNLIELIHSLPPRARRINCVE